MSTMHFISDASLALTTHTAMKLSSHDLIALQLRPGDRLRSDCGTLWLTVDGDLHDVLLEAGSVHTALQGATVNVSAMRTACLVVLGRAPLRWKRVGANGRGLLRRVALASAQAVASLRGLSLSRPRSLPVPPVPGWPA